jgi:hypothetical protein
MKLPPFAKQMNPDAREVWLYFGGDPWPAAKCRAARKLPVLLLPPDQNPEAFRWPVAGKQVLMIQQGGIEIQKIPAFASLLFSYGASVVRCIYGEGDFVSYERKSCGQAA